MEHFNKEILSPRESSKERPRFHEISLLDDHGERIANATLQYRNDVVPSYYIEYLEVREGSRGLKIGKRLVGEINSFLVSKRAVGVLHAVSAYKEAEYIYQKAGWKFFEDTSIMFFNEPNFLGKEDKEK